MGTIRKALINIQNREMLEFPEDMLLFYNGESFPVIRQVGNHILIKLDEYGNLWIDSKLCSIINTIDTAENE
jgi:hypothetical protein